MHHILMVHMFILMVLWGEYGAYVYFDGFMRRIWCICLFWQFYEENMVHMFILMVLWWEYGACLYWQFYEENMVHMFILTVLRWEYVAYVYFVGFMMRIWCLCLFWQFYDENMVHMFIYSHRKTVKINICTIFSS
jgi:hypothetical protein